MAENITPVIDIYLRRHIYLDRYADSQISDYLKQLETMRDRAVTHLETLARTRGQAGAYQRHIAALDEMIRQGTEAMKTEFVASLTALTPVEAAAEASAIASTWPAAAASVAVVPDIQTSPAVLGAASASFDKMNLRASTYLRGVIAEAVSTGTTTRDAVLIAQAGAGRYFDGMGKAHLKTIIRSGIMGLSASIRNQTMEANARVVETIAWLSTLDNRTTIFCAARDGLVYSLPGYVPVDHDLPWESGPGSSHYNCRSISVPTFGQPMEGLRAGKDYNEKDRRGKPGKGRQFRASTTFESWFQRQPAWMQKDYLGARRYELFKSGLSLQDFAAPTPGKLLTLDELQVRYSQVFNRA